MSQDSIQALEVEDTNTGQDLPAQTLPVQEPLATEPTEVPKKRQSTKDQVFYTLCTAKGVNIARLVLPTWRDMLCSQGMIKI